jgi:hypothetical protein
MATARPVCEGKVLQKPSTQRALFNDEPQDLRPQGILSSGAS